MCTRLVTVALAVTALAFAASAHASSVERVSITSSGAEGTALKGSFSASVSSDGRFVAFISTATNFDNEQADTNGQRDVFIRDRRNSSTRRISVSNTGVQSDGSFLENARISGDGRYVAFVSNATTLAPGGSAGLPRLYRYDRVAGTLQLVPLPAGATSVAGTNPGSSKWPSISISDDGSRIAFRASAAGVAQVWWWDAATGAVKIASGTDGTPGNGAGSFDANISGNGRFVGFTTSSTNLPGVTANASYRDVVVKDLQTGAFDKVSVINGTGDANLHSSTPALSGDGCIAAFYSDATNFVSPPVVTHPMVWAHDRCGDSGTTLMSLIGTNSATELQSLVPITISDDGCRIVFLGASGSSVQLRDRCKGTTGPPIDAGTGGAAVGGAWDASLSPATGRYVAFSTTSDQLEPGDSNGAVDVFLRTLDTNAPPVPVLATQVNGNTVTADGSGSSDPDGYILTGSINWGDGTVDTGLTGVHAYAHPGVFGVTFTATDADGISRTAIAQVTVGAAPVGGGGDAGPSAGGGDTTTGAGVQPILDRVSLGRTRFAPGAKVDAGHGTALSLRLNLAATVTVTIDRPRPGRKVKGVCRVGARKGSRCTAYKRDGVITASLPAGSGRIPISGTIGKKRLAPGTHRLTVRAVTADGQRTAAKTLTFTITKAKRKR